MTDAPKQENPISEAWRKHPEWRADFMEKVIVGNYKSLFEGLEKRVIDKAVRRY